MNQLLHWVIDTFSLSGDLKSQLIACTISTAIVVLSLVMIGYLAEKFESLQISLMASLFGTPFALLFANRITIVGTIVHELSHALAATITGAKVVEISFWDNTGNALGHISYANRGPLPLRAVQDSLTACAPTIVGLIALYILVGGLFTWQMEWWGYALTIYGLVCAVDHMSMSDVDLKNYFHGIWAPSLIIFAVFYCIA